MVDLSGFSERTVGSDAAQQQLDDKVEALSTVLQQDNPLETLAWLSEYSAVAARYAYSEAVELRLENVSNQLDAAGYGGAHDAHTVYAEAYNAIGRTLERMQDGLAPTGFEPIFAERIIAEANTKVDAETVDIA